MTSRRSSRRSFLATSGAFGATMLAGCAAVSTTTERALTNTSGLRIINWAEYIDPDSVVSAANALGFSIDYREDYTDNVTGLAEIIEPALGATGSTQEFDMIVPTNWLAARMINDGWVEALPLEEIPNHVNLDPAFLTNEWDRGSRFQMPWQAGITRYCL